MVRSHVPDDGGIGLAARQHDGEITDDGLSRPLAEHEGGKDDEGVPGSDKEIPVLQVLYGRRFPIPLFPEGTHGVGRERARSQSCIDLSAMGDGLSEAGIGMGAGLGPPVTGLRLERGGEMIDPEVAVAVGSVGIDVHDGLNEEGLPAGRGITKVQDGLAVKEGVAVGKLLERGEMASEGAFLIGKQSGVVLGSVPTFQESGKIREGKRDAGRRLAHLRGVGGRGGPADAKGHIDGVGIGIGECGGGCVTTGGALHRTSQP